METTPKPTFVERTAPHLRECEYGALSLKEINEEHEKLRALLKDLNEEVARMLEALHTKQQRSPTPSHREAAELLGIRSREFENSSAVIIMYKGEYSKLNRRVGELAERDSLLDIDRTAADIRAQIDRLQLQNRELRRESVLRGKTMVANDVLGSVKIRELRDLEAERVGAELKKVKLQEDMAKIETDIVAIKNKNLELQDASFKAEVYLKKQEERDKTEHNSKRLEEAYQQKLSFLESLKKKHELSFNQLQQRYLSRLKDLENSLANSNSIDEKIRSSEAKIL